MQYLKRYLARLPSTPRIADAPDPRLALSVVIPCMDEPDIIPLLEALQYQARKLSGHAVEALVVVNHPQDAPSAVKRRNAETAKGIRQWGTERSGSAFRAHVIAAFDLAPAGVGVARKLGMDEAAGRFLHISRPDGVIASLDGDCLVSGHYMADLITGFAQNPGMHAATLAYAHRLHETENAAHRRAMVCYELFLRYIELGWRHAGLPYAFTSIGSCFAVRANAYARHHGMNRRQAGEDFYFLHKLARERPLGHLDAATVYPSPRLSARTPFGTGQAVASFRRSGREQWLVAAPDVFSDLRHMRDSLDMLYEQPAGAWLSNLPERLATYLRLAGIDKAAANMRAHAASPASLAGRFFAWFDGLKAWRYVHAAPAAMPVERAVTSLARLAGLPLPAGEAESVLMAMRENA